MYNVRLIVLILQAMLATATATAIGMYHSILYFISGIASLKNMVYSMDRDTYTDTDNSLNPQWETLCTLWLKMQLHIIKQS